MEQIVKGRIMQSVGGLYTVRICDGEEIREIACRARGVFRHSNISPLVGDIVSVDMTDGEANAVIDEICERRNQLIRPPLANLDVIFVTMASRSPAPMPDMTDKLTAILEYNNIQPIIVVGKCELDREKAAEIKEIYAVKELYVEPTKCAYGVYECAIYDTAIESGLTVEQGKIAIAISKHETANYTSSLFKNNNNIGGLYNGNAGKFFSYTSVEDGIDAYVGNLKRGYFDKGLTTIETIQKKYAPINAINDPTGLNEHWVSGVTYYYNQL